MAKTYGFVIHDFAGHTGVVLSLEGFTTAEARDDAMTDVLMDLPWQCSFNAERVDEEDLH